MTASYQTLRHLLTRALLLAVLAVGLSAQAHAQDDQEYKKAYNAALEAAKAKDYNTAYTEFSRAAQLAAAQGDDTVIRSSKKVMAQIDNARGRQAAKGGNFDQALQHFDTGIANNPGYARNYHDKGDVMLSDMGNKEDGIATLQMAIEKANAEGTPKVARSANRKIEIYFLNQVKPLLENNPTSSQADQAIAILTEMEEYIEASADEYFYMAMAYNIKGDYAQAVAMADKALGMGRISRADQSKINFIKGEALMKSGDNEAARATFALVTTGAFRPSAEYELCNLGVRDKCQKGN
ncbi:MAG: hypothetical protein AAF730_08800 [Bacteroidota bacterium]